VRDAYKIRRMMAAGSIKRYAREQTSHRRDWKEKPDGNNNYAGRKYNRG